MAESGQEQDVSRFQRGRILRVLLGMVLASFVFAPCAAPSAFAAAQTPQALDLQQYKGKIVYLDFWASWCAPCKQSFPYMQMLHSSYAKRDLVVVAVNVDHDPRLAEAFIRQAGTSFPVIFDSRGALAAKYHVEDMPTSMLLGRDGRIRFVHKGFYPGREAIYQSHIEELLNEHL